jgi:membrane-associated protease RseP (regulator of RpoE activity)
MPSSDLSSNDSRPPSETPSEVEQLEHTSENPPPPVKWRLNLVLFVLTVFSVFSAQVLGEEHPLSRESLVHGVQFSGALLGILLAHEFGHFIAARLHKVDASLPFFIPIPYLSPFGTMGAIIQMRSRIPTRRALLDIGASGPLAGLAVAIPLYAWGVAHSKVIALESGGIELGTSLLSKLLDHVFAPPYGAGQDILLHPVAFAAWGGMFVTMINLLPVSQMDGGHVAYALFGPKQDTYARHVHRAVLAFFFVSLGSYVFRDVRAGFGLARFSHHVQSSMIWLLWFEVLAILGTLASRGNPRKKERSDDLGIRNRAVAILSIITLAALGDQFHRTVIWVAWAVVVGLTLAMERRSGVLRPHDLLDHPPTGAAPLDFKRKVIAVFTLAMFAALFMPTPFEM